jgi:soluble lytic murein transglycosylase
MIAHKPRSRLITQLPQVLLVAALLLTHTLSWASSSLTTSQPFTSDDQQLYKQTLAAIKKGHKTRSKEGLEQLKHYPLHPYLLQAQLSRELRYLPYQRVNDFLSTHSNSVTGKQLRKQWLRTLAAKKLWPQFIEYYQADIKYSDLRCSHIEALHQTGYPELAINKTTALWLSSRSQPNVCNSIFKRWQQAGMKTDNLVWQRINLALNNNNEVLARYLSKRASAKLKPYSRRLISVHNDPRRLQKQEDFNDNSPYTIDIVAHGLKRLAPKDRHLASSLWVNYRGYTNFSEEQYNAIRNKIARQIIASGTDDALQWLITHDPNAEDDYLMEWRIRLALRQQHWGQADQWISLLPDTLLNKPRWRYWLAKAWQLQEKNSQQAELLLQQLATERHYYGFLAADVLQQNYGFNHSQLITTAPELTAQWSPEIIRAQQFYQMGEIMAARREWNAATAGFDQEEMIIATGIAHQWGWHQQAINTTIKADQWNDLDIRFPLAYQDNMLSSAKIATIQPEWLYAIARQESAFGEDAYSSAGARGLMQILPSTGEQIAKRIGVPYNKQDLFHAEKNITLGSSYLKQLLDDFQGNRILATAAYNAGPHRVKKWLKHQSTPLPHDIWIETLPFHETRGYVKNVLAFSVIYGHRLGVQSPLFTQQELFIGN